MIKRIALILMLFGASAFGQTFSNIAIQNGPGGFLKAAPFAPVYLCQEGATSVAGCSLQTLYTNSSLSTPISPNAPTVSDGSGNFTFYATPGKYAICIVGVTTFCQNVIVGTSSAGGGGGNSPNLNLSLKFSNDYIWLVSPSPATLSANQLVTVTLSSCPSGVFGTWPGDVSFYHDPRWHYISVTAGSGGVQEYTRILGGSCIGDGNAGTLQFLTSQAHNSGYQVGTATAGIQEALNVSLNTLVSGSSFSYKNQGGTVVIEPGIHKIQAPITILNNSQRMLWMGSAYVECDFTVDQDCINAGDPGHYQTQNQIILDRPGLISGFANGQKAAIAVFANQTFIHNMVAFTASVANAAFGYGVEVVADQHFILDGMQFDQITRGASFVGAKIYAPGPFSGHAGTPYGGAIVTATVTNSGSGYVVNDLVTVTQTNAHDAILKVTGTGPLTLSVLASGAGYAAAAGLALVTLTGAGSGGIITTTNAGGDNAALGNIHHLESGNCNGNGIDWQSGQPLHVSDSVLQGFSQFGVRFSMANGGFGSLQMDNVYNEATCPNPLNAALGTAGLIMIGGRGIMNEGEAPQGTVPIFANQGGTNNFYYIVATNGVNGSSNLLYAGSAVLNGSPNVNVIFNQIPGATSYDLLASTTLYQAPFGTANWAVATGQAAGTVCASNVCTIVDTQAARTSYTVAAVGYAPPIPLWSGGLVLSNSATVTSPGSTSQLTLNFNDFNFTKITQTNTAGGSSTPVITTSRCILMDGSPLWQSCTGNEQDLAATLLHVATNGSGLNFKGRINFRNALGNGPSGHIITLVDSNLTKTTGNALGRPSNDANDTFIGFDAWTGATSSTGLTLGAPASISNYIGNIGDGSSWKERLTSSLKSFAVPIFTGANYIDSTEQATPANPAANTDRLYADSTSHTLKCRTSSGGDCLPSAGGGVTSFSGDGTIITNSASVGAVTATIAGTSGGVPFFNSSSTWASSGALTNHALVLGGGAAAAPKVDTGITSNDSGALTDTTTGTALTHTQGSISSSAPTFSHTVTWNAGGVAFTNWLSNITCTAAATASVVAGWGVGGTEFQMKYAGATCTNPQLVIPAGSTTASSITYGVGGVGHFQAAANVMGVQLGAATSTQRFLNGATVLGTLNFNATQSIFQTAPANTTLAIAGGVTTSTAIPAVLIGSEGGGNNQFTATSSNQIGVQFGNGTTSGTGALRFAPTSGTATFQFAKITGQINQTGGANGTVTDLLVSTTETALVGSHLLLDLGTGGTGGKFSVNNKGNIFTAGTNSVASTMTVSASTTGSVSFTNGYTSTPVCVLTPQTTGLTSWFLSAISNTGFTVTVAPSGTYTFGYICMGNPT